MMSFIMSGIVTTVNLGVGADFVGNWLGAWSLSGPCAVIGVLLTRPLAERITGMITPLVARPAPILSPVTIAGPVTGASPVTGANPAPRG
ncbi:MAG: DUF2798 domain-containing protein [Pseudomonadota bacterium]